MILQQHVVERLDIQAQDEARMTKRLEQYVTAQIADGVSAMAMEIALENALRFLQMERELGNAANQR